MFEYRTHNALVRYLIENQEKYFNFKIIRGASKFACYRDKEHKNRRKYKFCDLVGASKDTIYIIEVKTDKIILKDVKEYIKYIKYFIYSFKKIEFLFVAPRIAKSALNEIEKYDSIDYKLINDICLNRKLEKENLGEKYKDNDLQYRALWYINARLRPYLDNIDDSKTTVNENDNLENQFVEVEFYFSGSNYRIQIKFNYEYNHVNYNFEIIKRIEGNKIVLVQNVPERKIDRLFLILEMASSKGGSMYGYYEERLIDSDIDVIVKLVGLINYDFYTWVYERNIKLKD